MRRFLFIYYFFGGLLFFLPNWLSAQNIDNNIKSIEIVGDGDIFSSGIFDYQNEKTRSQISLKPEELCLPMGSKILSIGLQYRFYKDESEIEGSYGSLSISLKETESMPDYSYPYTYIEGGMTTCYKGTDQLIFDDERELKTVTYTFNSPYEYNGKYLVIDFLATTNTPLDKAPYISMNSREPESVSCLFGRNDEDPYPLSIIPNLILNVELPSGEAVPYIPFNFRKQILGYAPLSGSLSSVEIPILNLGDQGLVVKNLESSENFELESSKTIEGNSGDKIRLLFTPKNAGTMEETVLLVTSAGNIEMYLAGTTYRQEPYNRVIRVSPEYPLWEQLKEDLSQITELSIEGQVADIDMNFAFYEIPNLTRLDMSAAISTVSHFDIREENWPKFEQLALPAGIKDLGIPQNATNLSKLILPLGFERLYGTYNEETNEESLPSNLTTLIALGFDPINMSSDAIQTIETVYVPENAIENWKNDYLWRNKNVLPITDAVLRPEFGGNMVVRDEQVITMDNYPEGEIEISIKPDEEEVTASASLTNQAPVQIKELDMSYRLDWRGTEYDDPEPDGLFVENGAYSVFINENEEAVLQSISFNLKFQPWQWHFISFPFDVDRDVFVSAPDNGSREYVIRTYDGQSRASNGMYSNENWKNENNMLSAGCGYILQTEYPENNSYYDNYYRLSFRLEGEDLDGYLMKTNAVSIPLNTYESDIDDDKSWNLIGNPYLSFFDISKISFGSASIIVIWDGQGYIPISIKDDSYLLRPLEAFFVQKPDGEDNITFKPEGRRTNVESTGLYSLRSASDTNRKVLNLRLRGETYIDRTRVVINPSAQLGYDMNNDAIKWMSSNKEIPQLYTLGDDGKRYAINERPLGEGSVPIGFYVGQTGFYTFEKVEDETWKQIYLFDKYENKLVDLCRDSYSFNAGLGTVDDRFEICFDIPTSNQPVVSTAGRVWTERNTLHVEIGKKSEVAVYTASGIEKYRNQILAGSIAINLEPGFYLVRINETTHKVIIH